MKRIRYRENSSRRKYLFHFTKFLQKESRSKKHFLLGFIKRIDELNNRRIKLIDTRNNICTSRKKKGTKDTYLLT